MTTLLKTVDLLVLGGGPAGAAAAGRGAQLGLETLLLERKHLPRDKVCSGMIMGPWANEVIRDQFGELPDEILTRPKVLKGHAIHVAGARTETFEWRTPFAWRKDLDGWMVRQAVTAGATLWEGAHATSFAEDADGYRVKVLRDGEEVLLSARFLVGAEGAASALRKELFPALKVRYSKPLREHYEGSLSLDKDYFHWFFPKGRPRPRFNVNHKGDRFVIEGSGIRELQTEIQEILSGYGLLPSATPVKRDGCMIAQLHGDLVSGAFRPARGNAMLAGDAGGLILPITFEGIGTAALSGKLAAEAARDSLGNGRQAAEAYLRSLEPVVKTIARLKRLDEEVARSAEQGPAALAEALCRAYQETAIVER